MNLISHRAPSKSLQRFLPADGPPDMPFLSAPKLCASIDLRPVGSNPSPLQYDTKIRLHLPLCKEDETEVADHNSRLARSRNIYVNLILITLLGLSLNRQSCKSVSASMSAHFHISTHRPRPIERLSTNASRLFMT